MPAFNKVVIFVDVLGRGKYGVDSGGRGVDCRKALDARKELTLFSEISEKDKRG